jgi:ABC-type multidrug transport system fused ATPase/permease subunit
MFCGVAVEVDPRIDAEVEDVCKAAAIIHKIITFADRYQTIVGKNGVNLSGGEL